MVFRKKGLLAVAIGSILGVASYNASAAVATFCIEQTTGCPNGTTAPIKFAKEIKADDSTKAYIPTGGDGQTMGFGIIRAKQGWGFAAADPGIEFYVRLDLLSGGASGKAKFSAGASLNVVSLIGAGGSAFLGNVALAANTGRGDSFVVFKVTTVVNKATHPDGAIMFSLAPGNGIELSGKGNVDLVYSIGSSEDVSPTNAMYTKKVPLIQFEDSYVFSALDPVRSTSDVEANFLKFTNDRSTAAVAGFEFNKKDGVFIQRAASSASFTSASVGAIFDFGEGKTTLDVVGDFTMVEDSPAGSGKFDNAKTRVFLSAITGSGAVGTCSTGGSSNPTVVTASKVSFAPTDGGRYDVCVSANGLSAIPAGSYSVVLNAVGKNNRNTTDTTGSVYDLSGETTLSDVGSIVRNGTQLITPYMTTISGYLSRVMLSNYGSRDINYTVRLVTDDGANATAGVAASGTIKAGTLKQINASDLVAFSGKPRGAAIFTFVGANSDIQGIYQTVNLNTLDAQSVVMRRPGSGRGIQ
jgi:hypothetical protein